MTDDTRPALDVQQIRSRLAEELARFRTEADAALNAVTRDHTRQATTGSAAGTPVSGGQPSDPTRELASGGLVTPGGLASALQNGLSVVTEAADELANANDEHTATVRPDQQCDCRGCPRVACDGPDRNHCQPCQRIYDSGRDCGPTFHRRWANSHATRVRLDDLCTCTDRDHGHQPRFCSRPHDGRPGKLCADCRSCACTGGCGRGHDPGGCTGDPADDRGDCWACTRARYRREKPRENTSA